MTDESREQFREVLRAEAKELPRLVSEDAAKIRDLLNELPTLSSLATLGSLVYGLDPDNYIEWEREWASFQAEWSTRVVLSRSAPVELEPSQPVLDAAKFQQLLDRLQEMYRRMLRIIGTQFLRQGNTKPTPDDEVIMRYRLQHLAMRTMTYPHQEEAWLKSTFGQLHPELKALLGFNIDEAISSIKAIQELVNTRLQAHLRRASEAMTENEKSLREIAESRGLNTSEDQDQFTKAAVASWIETFMDEVFLITPAELPQPAAASRFLQQFSLPFGLPPPKRPGPVPEVRIRPIVQLGDNHYFSHLPLLIEALRPNIEEAIKSDETLWERYEDIRKAELESRAAQFMQMSLPRAEVHRNVRYVSSDGKIREVDVLCRIDRSAFFVECKAGGLNNPNRQSAIIKTLRKTLRKGHQQAIGARDHVTKGTGEFELLDGTTTVLRNADFDRMVLVLVTLDDISAFVTNSAAAVAAQILEPRDIVWAVSVHDLEIIADMCDLNAMLPHYLTRRFRIAQWSKFDAIEELDWFMHYMTEGLWFEDDLATAVPQNLMSYTKPLDDYYGYVYGPRSIAAPKPTLKIQPEFKELVRAVEAGHRSGWLECVLMLLDLSHDAREKILEQIKLLKKKAKRGPTGCVFLVADYLIACYADRPGLGMLRPRMTAYAKARMVSRGVRRGTVIGFDVSTPEAGPLVALIDALRDRMPSATEAAAQLATFKSSDVHLSLG